MTDGPQQCALPGCTENVEQPDDGGPRRLYCSPAHRAAARKRRHAARMDATTPLSSAGADVTQPIAQAPENQPSEQPTTELPAPLGVPRQEEPDQAPEPDRQWSPAAAWTVSPPTLPPAPAERTVRTITSRRVKKQKPARTAAERKNAGAHMRRRAIASVAIASLVAGGASYFVTQNVIPNTPTTLPPQASNQPSMEADVWAGQAEVVLASLSTQLDAVAQAEASWLALPAQRRAQEPAAVQALKDRKALLEQQRATLTSQLEAFKALPDRTTELTSAQAQLDAVERTLNESTSTAASPDYQEALRQLESQRDIRRQQRDHAAQALTDLRNGVETALSSPLPADKDETAPIVERVKAVVEGRPDPGDKDDDQEHNEADGQDPAATPRREDGDDEERGDVGTTAPPDPERPNSPDILADGGGDSGSDTDTSAQGDSDGGDESEGPVQSITSALGQSDTTNRDESANRREARDTDDTTGHTTDGDDNGSSSDHDTDGGGLGGVVRGVTGGLLGGSDGDDNGSSSKNDDNDESRGRNDDDDRSDRNNSSSWWSNGGDNDDNDDGDDQSSGWFDRGDGDDDNDDRGNGRNQDDDDNDDGDDHSSGWFDRGDGDDDNDDRGNGRNQDDDEDDDDRGGLSDITDGLFDGHDGDDDEDDDHGHDTADSDEDDSDEHADDDGDRKRPSGKAERERNREKNRGEESEHRGDNDDDKGGDKADHDDDNDRGDNDRGDKDDDDRGDKGHGDKDDDGGDDDKGGSDDGDDDGGDDDGGKSDKGGDSDSGGGDSDSGDSDSGDSDSGDSDSGDSDSGGGDSGGDD